MAKKKRQWPPAPEPLPFPVMDNHTHLPVFEGQIPKADGVRLSLKEQLRRAESVGVEQIITVGCELPDFDGSLELARAHPQVRVALAIHPNEAALHAGHFEDSPDGLTHERDEHGASRIPLIVALERVSDALSDPMVVAVGETGLDYFRTAEPGREAQKESFRAHLEMARVHGLPLQIHDRDAHADTLEVLAESAHGNQPIVFHCFSGDAEMARHLADNGWFASFAGPLTYPANESLRAALLEMPRELVLAETDAPYLTPAPDRGCPNASYLLPNTVRQIAQLWDEDIDETCRQLQANSVGLYGAW